MQVPQMNSGGLARQLQFLTFNLGSDAYGVDILKVREIRRWEAVRTIPDAPEDIRGVLDLRGSIVPIVDLRQRLGCADTSYSATTVVIIVMIDSPGEGDQLLGLVVDAVSGVLDVDANEVKSAPDNVQGLGGTGLAGMVSMNSGMVVLLDLETLLGGSADDARSLGNE